VTLLRKPIGKKEVVGADGVLTYQDDPAGGNELEPCVVDISTLGPAHCTAVRTGRKMPVKDGRVQLQMPSGEGLPLAVLPYTVSKVDLRAQIEGQDLHVSWRLVRDAEPAAGFAPHAVRMEVSDQDGKADPALSQNATCAANGAGSLVVPLAREDAGRALKISLRHVLTFAQASTKVKVPKQM